jgi:Tfp pilus assembly protein PilZ
VPTARIRFGSWEELARFVTQSDGRGLFVRTNSPPPIGTELNLQLVLPDGRDLALPGRVAHRVVAESGSDPGIGVQITHMSEEQAERLQQLMSNPEMSRSLNKQVSQRPGAKSVEPPAMPPPPPPPAMGALLVQAYTLLERARFDTAERNVMDVLGDDPANVEAQKLLLIIQARRLRSQFDFDRATQKYRAVLKLDPEHEEATEQVGVLEGEIEHSKALFERVFGGSGNKR